MRAGPLEIGELGLYVGRVFWGNAFLDQQLMNGAEAKESARWTLREQIAFECALVQDEREDWQSLRERDRAMAIPAELWEKPNRRVIAKRWLSQRLRQAPSIKLAADSISQSISVAGQLLAVVGCLFGIGVATAALAYTGEAPINVSAFFSVFVLLQAAFALIIFIPFLLPRALKERLAVGPLFRFARFLFNFAFGKTQALTNRFLSGQNRHEAAAMAAEARSRLALHGGVVKWLAFTKIQTTALLFNIGALIALLVAVVFSDRAFGWQTTLDVSSQSVQAVVDFFAAPWAWFYGEGLGVPSLEQIEGSRIRLKKGIQSLDTSHLAAWWRFLALGILVYGILPRALFFLLGNLQMRSALRRYDFRNAAAERLFGRLTPEPTRFSAEEVDQSHVEPWAGGAEGAVAMTGAGQRVFCLFSKELAEAFDMEALRSGLARRWNLPESSLEMRVCANGVFPNFEEAEVDTTQYAVVFESWMPPIKEIERQLRTLRSELDARSLIKIVLLGIPKSEGEAVSFRPSSRYAETWRSFVRRQGDPYLILDNPGE